ncbi:MAG: EamA family transporter [Chloroflexi bacterium]|nr:EamA family transporter [Chloroflexota bacterium]
MNALPYILVSGVFAVLGQILLKWGLAQIGPLTLAPARLPELVLALALNPLVVLGLVVTVTGTFFWLITLSRVDLSFAYPFASLNYVAVLVGSWLLLGESPSPVRLLGVLAICGGVCLIARTSSVHREVPAVERSPQIAAPSLSVRQSL